jgi:hypothetical protein
MKINTLLSFENSVTFSQRFDVMFHKIAARTSKLGRHRNIVWGGVKKWRLAVHYWCMKIYFMLVYSGNKRSAAEGGFGP